MGPHDSRPPEGPHPAISPEVLPQLEWQFSLCSHGPFLIVFVATDDLELFTRAYVYSSEAGAWSELTCVEHVSGDNIDRGHVPLWGTRYTSCLK